MGNWISKLSSYLPSIGGLIGTVVAPGAGTAVGAAAGKAGEKALNAVAEYFGVEPNEKAVEQAIENATPEQMIELKKHLASMEMEMEIEFLRARVQNLSDINRTMQVEQTSESLFKSGWRPLYGYICGLGLVGEIGIIFYILYRSSNMVEAIPQISNLIVSFNGLWIVALPVLGVGIWDRGKTKNKRLEAGLPSSQSVPTMLGKGIRKVGSKIKGLFTKEDEDA